jgi:putative ABC transport system substrate-binding protein
VKAGGLVISNEGLLIGRSEQLAGLALRDKLSAIHVSSTFTAAGGLASYGARTSDTDRLLHRSYPQGRQGGGPSGHSADELRACDYLNTAKAHLLTVPPTLLATADEVIE